jgi:predicted O-methyltransferase YrrM
MSWLRAVRGAKEESPRLDLVDVSDRLGEFDPAVLEIVPVAPVWMTRAERLLLFTLTFTLRPARYLEIGTLQGGSALLVAAAMDTLGTEGRLVCLDPNPQIAEAHWARLRHRTTLLRGCSPDALPQARDLAGQPFDLVLVDGDHTAAGVIRDATGVLSVVTPGAHVLFHDCFNPGVGGGIDEFVREHAARVQDVGPLTREISCETAPDGSQVVWGGLRLVIVR